MGVKVYQSPMSPPCRAVSYAAKGLGVEVELVNVDMGKGEHMQPEFLKMNPQHTLPILEDDGLYLTESRAIMTYLANAYGKDDSLYPKNPKKRAMVDQRLLFDQGTLYSSYADCVYKAVFGMEDGIPDYKRTKLATAVGYLDGFLSKTGYVAGDCITLADYTLIASVSSIEAVGFDFSPYKNIVAWHKKCQDLIPGYDLGPVKMYGQFFKGKLTEKGLCL